jgi:sporulation protein YlmC with PRC-barrel domain
LSLQAQQSNLTVLQMSSGLHSEEKDNGTDIQIQFDYIQSIGRWRVLRSVAAAAAG